MRVLELWRYPIKSVGGEQLDRAEVSDVGIAGDRGWGLVDETTGNVLTARREPRLLMATCRIVDGEPVTTTDDGREITTSAQYSEWLERPVRLEPAGADGGTYENPMDVENDADWVSWQGPGGAWHDSGRARVSIVTAATLGAWDLRRFRVNVVVDGTGENDLIGSSITIGSTGLDVIKGIERCVMVTRPQPGLDRDLDVLKTINRERDGVLSVGATVNQTGTIEVGDELQATG